MRTIKIRFQSYAQVTECGMRDLCFQGECCLRRARNYVSMGRNYSWHIDGYDNSDKLGFQSTTLLQQDLDLAKNH